MDSLEYYKSLVTESEVINALIKESRVRDEEVERSRVRPNLQFFQRTVSNLVSSNNRITVNQEKIRAKEKEKNTFYRPKKNIEKRKLPIEYIKEILSKKIEFVKSSEGPVNDTCRNIEDNDVKKITASPRQKKTVICKKSPFQQIREILTNNKTQQIPQISSDDFNKEERCSVFRRKLCPNESLDKSRDSPDIQIINKTDSCSSFDTMDSLKTKKSKKRRYSSSSYSSTDSESVSKSKKCQKHNNFSETTIIHLSSTSSSSSTGSESCVIIEGPSCNT